MAESARMYGTVRVALSLARCLPESGWLAGWLYIYTPFCLFVTCPCGLGLGGGGGGGGGVSSSFLFLFFLNNFYSRIERQAPQIFVLDE